MESYEVTGQIGQGNYGTVRQLRLKHQFGPAR